jgi:hypothetical protein
MVIVFTSFTFILIKAKLIARWGRKATGLWKDSRAAQVFCFFSKDSRVAWMGTRLFLCLNSRGFHLQDVWEPHKAGQKELGVSW